LPTNVKFMLYFPLTRTIHRMAVNVDKLVRLRVDKGWSQRRLAKEAGVTPLTVWNLENGSGAHPSTLKKLGDVLGVRASELMREDR
jgi:transcriptional regulator with XRE-family HTH domain